MIANVLPMSDYVARDGTMIAPDAIKKKVERVPVTVGFDAQNVVGEATVFPNGTADIRLFAGDVDFSETDSRENMPFTIGYRLVRGKPLEGKRVLVEELDPLVVSVLPSAYFTTETGPTKVRDGDQPLPLPVGGPAMQDLVIADVEERKAIGIKRYGQTLRAHDGRDALLDAYQEALDLCVYLRKLMFERDGK
jgi:hypothetical protein